MTPRPPLPILRELGLIVIAVVSLVLMAVLLIVEDNVDHAALVVFSNTAAVSVGALVGGATKPPVPPP